MRNVTPKLLAIMVFFGGLVLPPLQVTSAREGAPELSFTAKPTKPRFKAGEKILFSFAIRNQAPKPVLLSQMFILSHDIYLKIISPDGSEAPWCGGIPKVVAVQGKKLRALASGQVLQHTLEISCNKEMEYGYTLLQPGKYTVHASYTIPLPPEHLKRTAGDALVAKEPYHAPPVEFWIISKEPTQEWPNR